MSRKSKERKKKEKVGRKAVDKATPAQTPEALRRRRNRRFLFVGLIGICFPIFEVVAYQFRAITITFINRSELAIKGIKVTYTGGEFELPELKPGGSQTRLIRPDFSFTQKGDQFSSYALTIRYATENGNVFSQIGRAGTLDYSAQEIYTITQSPEGGFQLQHTNRPGFPLSLVRDLMERLGFG